MASMSPDLASMSPDLASMPQICKPAIVCPQSSIITNKNYKQSPEKKKRWA